VMAAHIKGKPKPIAVPMYAEDPAATTDAAPAEISAEEMTTMTESATESPAAPKRSGEMNVVLVTDVDMLSREIFQLRQQGNSSSDEVKFNFDNVTFVLNTLDELAGDNRFIDIRKRRAEYRTLEAIEQRTGIYLENAMNAVNKFNDEFEASIKKEQETLNAQVEKARKDKNLDRTQLAILLEQIQEAGTRRLQAKTDELQRERDENIEQAERTAQLEIADIQNHYKLLAVALPPIPPLVVGLIVFFNRRAREREGVSRNRLRMT
jgi:ABC-2 type transport system permease protein